MFDCMKRKRVERDAADYLIWRSTGTFGGFRFRTLINILLYDPRLPYLTDENIKKILKRYHKHCEFWNISTDTIATELFAFSKIVNRDGQIIARWFDESGPVAASAIQTLNSFKARTQ